MAAAAAAASMRKGSGGGGEGKNGEMGTLPSSWFSSWRSRSRDPESERNKTMWGKVRDSLVDNTLVAVGLLPTREEARHWDVIRSVVLDNKPTEDQDAGTIQPSHKPKDTPVVRHLSGRELSSRVESDTGPRSFRAFSGRPESVSSRQMSVRRTSRSTGRNQAVPLDQLKPDLWKLAFNTMRTTSVFSRKGSAPPQDQPKPKSSFDFVEGGEEDVDDDVFPLSGGGYTSPRSFSTIMEEEEEEEDQFFGSEKAPQSPRVDFDGREEGGESAVKKEGKEEHEKPKNVRREQIKGALKKVTFNQGYVGGAGGLGTVTKLLDFKYKHLSPELQKELDDKLLHKRPFFTYWLMVVHLIIMVIALGLYGFAPYGWDLIPQRESVRQTDLSFATTERNVVPSVWLGPPQQALVLLGALFAPCMRTDRQIFEAIDMDREMERDMSGCCVRRDMSGCFQVTQNTSCQRRFSMFYFMENNARAVCGTSPDTCTDPAPGVSRGDDIWNRTNILTWPICRADTNANVTIPHLTCEITSRPCCHGVQANCIITTREQCNFLAGRFHQDAFLCSQVDCLNEICGLLPFSRFNQPDQVYRLYIALFLHAGLIHLLLSLVFSFFVLRHVEKRLGWWRTAVLYIFSGIGGNLVSAYLAPYNPEVGPAGSALGVVAYFFVFLIFESPLLMAPWKELLKLLGVCLVLFLLGFFPFIDNYAHIGGFFFGFLIGGILVPYGDFKEIWKLVDHKNGERYSNVFLIVKLVMVLGGLVAVLLLFALFFVLFYAVQSTWVGFSYLTCIPFTSTLCLDQQVLIRDRDTFIV